MHKQLGEPELFGESLYAVHSIGYSRPESYFYLFAIREGGRWLAWDEVEVYAGVLGLPTVPVLFRGSAGDLPGELKLSPEQKLKAFILKTVSGPGSLSGPDIAATPREGVVARVARSFDTEEFPECVFKWVRKNHVQTDEHWTRNRKRAKLHFEWGRE